MHIGFNWGHQCWWIIAPAVSMPVFNMLLFTAREGLNLLHPRSLRQMGINQVPIFLGHLHILLHKMKKQGKNGLESELILYKLKSTKLFWYFAALPRGLQTKICSKLVTRLCKYKISNQQSSNLKWKEKSIEQPPGGSRLTKTLR